MSSNPWLSNSRWMKCNKDSEEQSESETGMSNSQNAEYALAHRKEMTCLREMKSLRDELQGWKNKCVKMEEEFRKERDKWKRVLMLKQNELIKMEGKLGKMAEDLEKTQLERERLAGKYNRMDELIEELEKLGLKFGLTGLMDDLDRHKHTLSVNKVNRYSQGCSVSDSKDAGRLVDVGMDIKGKLGEMKPIPDVGLTGLSKKVNISQCQAGISKKDKILQCEVSPMGFGKNDKISRCQVDLSKKDKNWQCEFDLVNCNKKNKRSQHPIGLSNLGKKDGLMDVRMEVKENFGEMKPQSEIMLTGVGEKEKITGDDNILEDTQRRPHCTIITPLDNRAGERMLKRRFEDFDKWMGADKEREAREANPQAKCCKIDMIRPSDNILEAVSTKEEGKGEEDAELQDVHEEMEVHVRCKQSDGKQWRCSYSALPGRTLCHKRFNHAQQKSCTITTPLDNRAGERMLKRGFEDFDKWMGADKEREVREANPQAKCCKIDMIPPSDNTLEAMSTKEEGKGEKDAELQDVHEEMEVQVRCKRSDGKQWRCSYSALPGRTLCHKHFNQAQQKSCKNRKVECEWGNAKKPKKDISTITECKRSLSVVTRQQQGNKEKCRSDDEEYISDSEEEEPPNKKRNSRLRDEEEEDPDYSPTMRRKQKYEKLESSPIGSVALNAGHDNFKKGTCSVLDNDHLTPGKGRWEQIDLVSRDGQMKLSTQVLFASFDQRSERAAGESACSALVAVIADWLHKNTNLMLTKPLFDALIQKGSSEWRNLCEIEAYKQRFPDGHFDLETVLEAKVCSLSLAPDKSFVAFFQPEKMGDSFEFLRESMSFDKIWEEIINGAYAREGGSDGPQIYIVTWNDHFFLLKVEKEACCIIDTLGERLFEGCNQAYILKFDKNTIVYHMGEEEKSSTTSQSASVEISKSNGNKLQHGSAKIGNTGQTEIVESNNVKGKLICNGKESCKEFIKGFWAALTLRELENDIKMGLLGRIHPYQRLQIEFHFTCLTYLEWIEG